MTPVSVYMRCAGFGTSADGHGNSALPLFQTMSSQAFQGVTTMQFVDYADTNHGTVVAPTLQPR